MTSVGGRRSDVAVVLGTVTTELELDVTGETVVELLVVLDDDVVTAGAVVAESPPHAARTASRSTAGRRTAKE